MFESCNNNVTHASEMRNAVRKKEHQHLSAQRFRNYVDTSVASTIAMQRLVQVYDCASFTEAAPV